MRIGMRRARCAVAHVSSKARLTMSFELRVDLVLLPEVLLQALHPLEVRDDDAAGVREDVGEDEHALVLEDRVGGRGDGAVRALDDDLRLDLGRRSRSSITCSSAHGARMSQSSSEQLVVRDLLAARRAGERAVRALVRERGRDVDARSRCGAPPAESEIATTVAPSSWRNFARNEPTLPKPCTATVMAVEAAVAASPAASRMQKRPPRAVASSRPSEPPIDSGFPVTTPSTEWPLFIEYVSKIQAIIAPSVPTSGAGMSFSGPISLMISVV